MTKTETPPKSQPRTRHPTATTYVVTMPVRNNRMWAGILYVIASEIQAPQAPHGAPGNDSECPHPGH